MITKTALLMLAIVSTFGTISCSATPPPPSARSSADSGKGGEKEEEEELPDNDGAIEGEGTREEEGIDGADASPGGSGVKTQVEVINAIYEDSLKLTPGTGDKMRYFTLHVLNAEGAKADAIETQRLAFKKTINSLSKKSRLAQPEAIDAEKLIYRINLDDIAMTSTLFDKVLQEHYPYFISFRDVGSAESTQLLQKSNSLRTLSKSNYYLVRMDWFNATASLPVLYRKFLELPNVLSTFDVDVLGPLVNHATIPLPARNLVTSAIHRDDQYYVDKRVANIVQDQVIRVGFDNSFVSRSNRIVEHHASKAGSYWISYDFKALKLGDLITVPGVAAPRPATQADLDSHNINKSPLGPPTTNRHVLEFKHDGGEVIYSLPNGLFGYYLIDGRGVLIDKGPVDVVRQNGGPSEFSLAITNGLSCMSCHNKGLLKQTDTILTGALQNKNGLTPENLARINRLYNEAAFNAKIDSENAIYRKALQDLGIDPDKPDPVDIAYRSYNRPVTKEILMAELELTEKEYTLLLVDPAFSGIFNSLNTPGGFVSRAVFQSAVAGIIKKFKQDFVLNNPIRGDYLVTADCMEIHPVLMDKCVINGAVVR